MKISDLLTLSLNNLKRRKGRTILTVLGVFIGTCSIIMMLSIGVALNKSIDDMMQGMGDLTLIEVYNWGGSMDGGSVDPMTDEVIDGWDAMPNVVVATPVYQFNSFSVNLVSGNNDKYKAGISIQGIRKKAMPIYGYELEEGRFPNEKDKEYAVLAGQYLGYQFTNTSKRSNNYVDRYDVDENGNPPKPFVDVQKDTIKLKTEGYDENVKNVEKEINVVGVMKEDGSKYETLYGLVMDIDDVIALEEEYNKANNIKSTNSKKRAYTNAIVKVDDIENVDRVVKSIEDMGYSTWSATSYRNEMKKQTQLIQLILGGLGSIAMVVSAISIANTMTMAIYERTKEIGVMKVLGCELGDIKKMFLTEAAGIGFLGGAIGLIVCYALSRAMNYFAASYMGGDSKISIITIPLALFGLAFSTMVGIISGYVPAVKAVKVTALSAIRHE